MRTCTECGVSKPIEAFVPIKGRRPGAAYGRCRACRNARQRALYHASAEFRAKEIARALKNKHRRRTEV